MQDLERFSPLELAPVATGELKRDNTLRTGRMWRLGEPSPGSRKLRPPRHHALQDFDKCRNGRVQRAVLGTAPGLGSGFLAADLARKDEGGEELLPSPPLSSGFQEEGSLACGKMNLSQSKGELLPAGVSPMVGKGSAPLQRCTRAWGLGDTCCCQVSGNTEGVRTALPESHLGI